MHSRLQNRVCSQPVARANASLFRAFNEASCSLPFDPSKFVLFYCACIYYTLLSINSNLLSKMKIFFHHVAPLSKYLALVKYFIFLRHKNLYIYKLSNKLLTDCGPKMIVYEVFKKQKTADFTACRPCDRVRMFNASILFLPTKLGPR